MFDEVDKKHAVWVESFFFIIIPIQSRLLETILIMGS